MDTGLFFLIHRDLAVSALDPVMVWISRWWFVPVFALLAVRGRRERADVLLAAALALVALGAADAIGAVIKEAVGRPRPCAALTGVRALAGCGNSGSFPSNHAGAVFAVATVLARSVGSRWMGSGFLVIAALVGWSRIYVGAHYPGDVVGGMLLGIGVGWPAARFGIPFMRDVYRQYPERTLLGVGLFLLTAFRLIYVARGPLDLAGDEAHYWEWSRRLDWSYYSKGPFIAYWIRLLTSIFGTTEIGLRAGSAVFSAATSVVLFDLARRLYRNERAGLWAAGLFQLTPGFFVYGLLMTIDPPFFFFWSLALWVFVGYCWRDPERWGPWALLGLVFGVGLLAKYTMGLFAACVGLALLVDRDRRRILLRPQPYMGLLVGFLVFLPVIFWNATHEWVTFRHTAGQVAINDGVTLSIASFGNFLGSQIGVIGPLLLPVLVWGLFQDDDDRRRRLIGAFTLPVLLFFLLKSAQGKVQGNWALPGYIALYLSLGALATGTFRVYPRRLIALAAGLSLAMTSLALSPATIHRLGFRISGQDKMIGWQELGRSIGRVRDGMPVPEQTFVASDYYMVASELAFYMPGNPVTYAVNLGTRRMNQYDLWPGIDPDQAGGDGIFVIMGASPVPSQIRDAFDRFDVEILTVGTDMVPRKFTVIRGFGFRGFPVPEVKSF